MATEVSGNLLTAPGLLVHQVNVVTTRGRGLSQAMFAAFPEADIYSQRTSRTPGQVIVTGRVVNLVGQHRPGKPTASEPRSLRLQWFYAGLNELLRVVQSVSQSTDPPPQVSFPYGIGCGLAGGDWREYRVAIETFAKVCPVPVVIYRI